MKTTILIFTLFLFTSGSISQAHFISLMPNHGQGYLVVNPDAAEGIDHWIVEIVEREYSDLDYSDVVVSNLELVGKNYMKISNSFLNSSSSYYFISVAAMDNEGNQIEK